MTATLDGDDSLRRRPVARIIEPLRSMGAALQARRNDSLPPLTVVGRTPLRAIDYTTPVPSAQVKSAILLAGLRAEGRTTVRESVATRDHTERMLRARGVPVERVDTPDGAVAWTVQGGVAVNAMAERVPGDVSAAAFWLVAGAIHPDAELTIRDVGVNPTRRAVIDILRRMGADIDERAVRAGRRRRRRRADRGPRRSLVGAAGRRARAGRRGRRDRRDPDPVPRRHRRSGHDRDPRRRRAPPQGIGPDRRHRRRPARARRADRGRRRRPAHRRRAAPSAAPRPTASTTIGSR